MENIFLVKLTVVRTKDPCDCTIEYITSWPNILNVEYKNKSNIISGALVMKIIEYLKLSVKRMTPKDIKNLNRLI